MMKQYLSECLSLNPELFNAILDFNGYTQKSEPPNDLWSEDFCELWSIVAVRRFFTQKNKMQNTGFWDFDDETCRLLLLPEDILNCLILTFGATLHADEISRTIVASEQLDLRNYLGMDIYLYAIRRGRYQVGTLSAIFSDLHKELPLPIRCRKDGELAISIISNDWKEDARILCRKKIDGISPLPDKFVMTPDLRRKVWFLLKKILIKEVAPKWAPCFN